MNAKQVNAVTDIIKKKFPNLSTSETVNLVCDIIEVVEKNDTNNNKT